MTKNVERDIIQALAEGKGSKEIAGLTKYRALSVDTYRVALLRKYNARNTPHLIHIAYQTGILKIQS